MINKTIIQRIKGLVRSVRGPYVLRFGCGLGFYRRWVQPIPAYFCMRSLWRRRLAAYERKALYIHRLQYFGDYRCYREFMDLRRYKR